jgi:uncharacterized protein (DUF1330 family)
MGGRYLVRGGTFEVFEGDSQPSRLIILEFPDMDALPRRWYGSDDYWFFSSFAKARRATTSSRLRESETYDFRCRSAGRFSLEGAEARFAVL